MNIHKLQNVKIDRRASLPIHIQLSNAIKSLILDRMFHFQEVMPDVDAVAESLSLDVLDVKKAYQQLVLDNYLIQNGANFLAHQYDLTPGFFTQIIKLYDAIKLLGLEPTMKTVLQKTLKADQKLHEKSGFKKGTELFYLRRIYYGNHTPLIILDSYMPTDIFPGIDQKINDDTPLYELFARSYGQIVTSSRRLLSAINLPKVHAQIFLVQPGTAGYLATSLSYNKDQVLLDYTEGWSSDNYIFQTEVDLPDIKQSYRSTYR